MAFVFRFAKLLAHRRHQLREAQVALARAVEQAAQAERLVAETEETLASYRVRWQERARDGLSLGEHLAFQRYLAVLEQQLLRLKAARDAARRHVQEKQRLLLERDQEVKKLERLQEVDYEKFRWHQKKREQKKLDEFAVRSFDGGPIHENSLP
ncbi:MAG: flagellar export protein FliJ [Desulfosoma sp.]